MDLPAIEEYDEAELLYARVDGSEDEDQAVKSPNSDTEEGMWEMEADTAPRASIDIAPNSYKSGSGKSSTIHMHQGKDADDDADDAPEFPELVAHHAFQHAHAMASSMPARPAVRMGSSVPMNIPMNHFKKAGDAQKPGAGASDSPLDTFIPPHELSQSIAATQGFAFSLATGESLASMKREKLRARNVILKSTGFLEDGVGEEPPLMPPAFESGLVTQRSAAMHSGGLSKALGSTSIPAASEQ